jgi:hypothetical protein
MDNNLGNAHLRLRELEAHLRRLQLQLDNLHHENNNNRINPVNEVIADGAIEVVGNLDQIQIIDDVIIEDTVDGTTHISGIEISESGDVEIDGKIDVDTVDDSNLHESKSDDINHTLEAGSSVYVESVVDENIGQLGNNDNNNDDCSLAESKIDDAARVNESVGGFDEVDNNAVDSLLPFQRPPTSFGQNNDLLMNHDANEKISWVENIPVKLRMCLLAVYVAFILFVISTLVIHLPIYIGRILVAFIG